MSLITGKAFSSFFGVESAFILVILFLFIKYIYKKFQRDPRLVQFATQFPGPADRPIVGNVFDFLSPEGSVEKMTKLAEKYESKYRFWLGKDLVIVLYDVKDLEDIAKNSKLVSKSKMFDLAVEFFGDGLLTISKSNWKAVRTRVQPFFTRNMQQHVPGINRVISKHVEKIKKLANGRTVDLWSILPYLNFDIITGMLFDVEISEEDKSRIQFHEAIKRATEIFIDKMFRPWLRVKLIDNFVYKEDKRLNTIRTTALINMVLQNELSKTSTDQTATVAERRSSFLLTVSQIQEDLNLPTFMNDEIITEVGGGTDTSAATMSAFLLAIAIHSEIQEKLHAELDQVFGDDDRAADISDIDNLPYLDQVLKETQRRFSVVPIAFKGVDEDTKIGSYVYPAGTSIVISIINVHLNPDYYPNPLEFNPENFSPEAVSKRPKLTFIPFGVGYRNCIGKNLAPLEMKLTLIALLRNFTFHTTVKMEDIKLAIGFISVSSSGYKVSMKLRSR